MSGRGDLNSPRIMAIKQATRDVVEACGGLERSAGEVTIGKSQLQRCYAHHSTDTISMRDALTLDEQSLNRGGPFILKAMARQLDHVVIALPDGPEDAEGIACQLMEVTGELGDLSAHLARALADGHLDQPEARQAIRRWDELMEASARLGVSLRLIAYPDTAEAPREG